jgi:hypothetical protein
MTKYLIQKKDRNMRKWIIEWVGQIKANTNMSNLKHVPDITLNVNGKKYQLKQ